MSECAIFQNHSERGARFYYFISLTTYVYIIITIMPEGAAIIVMPEVACPNRPCLLVIPSRKRLPEGATIDIEPEAAARRGYHY